MLPSLISKEILVGTPTDSYDAKTTLDRVKNFQVGTVMTTRLMFEKHLNLVSTKSDDAERDFIIKENTNTVFTTFYSVS